MTLLKIYISMGIIKLFDLYPLKYESISLWEIKFGIFDNYIVRICIQIHLTNLSRIDECDAHIMGIILYAH